MKMCLSCDRKAKDASVPLKSIRMVNSLKKAFGLIRKKKELAVSFVLDGVTDITYLNDKTLNNKDMSCPGVRMRPDFQITHKNSEYIDIIIEVDEFQHRSYESKSCELSRLNNLMISRQYHIPMCVIRVNLDTFKTTSTAVSLSDAINRHAVIVQELHAAIALGQGKLPSFLLRVVYICFDCSLFGCVSAACPCVHVCEYADQESIMRDLQRAR